MCGNNYADPYCGYELQANVRRTMAIAAHGCLLGFSNFQILFKFLLLYLRLTRKQHLAVEIHEIGRIHCEVVSI